MKIYVTKTQLFDQDLFQNLLILLNRNKGLVPFNPLFESVKLKQEEIQTRCIPNDKLGKKFIIQPSLLTEVSKVLEGLDSSKSLLQKNTLGVNTMYARSIRASNAGPSEEYKKFAALQLIYGMLRISFVKQSYPLAPRINEDGLKKLVCDAGMGHDVFVDTKLLFQKCLEQRKQHNLKEADFLILFTSVNIDANWIYSLDPTFDNNIVINLHLLSSMFDDRQLLAALTYYVAAGVLAKLMHWSFMDWYLHQHPQSKGCIMDFNYCHNEAFHTVSTSNICPACKKIMTANEVPTELLAQFSKIIKESLKELRMEN